MLSRHHGDQARAGEGQARHWIMPLASLLSSSVTSFTFFSLTPPTSFTSLKLASAPFRITNPRSALPPASGADWLTTISAATGIASGRSGASRMTVLRW